MISCQHESRCDNSLRYNWALYFKECFSFITEHAYVPHIIYFLSIYFYYLVIVFWRPWHSNMEKNNLWPWLEVGLCLGGGSWTQGFWYFAEKKAKFRGIFRGKFVEKLADFAGFSQEKSQNSRKNRPISREISGGNFAKKQLVKKSWFRWIFLGKFS